MDITTVWGLGKEMRSEYVIEYITDPKNWEIVCSGKHDAPWELYETKTFDSENMGEAISFLTILMMRGDVFDVRMFETIYINEETILERTVILSDTFRHSMRMAVNRDLQDQNERKQEMIDAQGEMISNYQEFIKKYNATNLFEKFVRTYFLIRAHFCNFL